MVPGRWVGAQPVAAGITYRVDTLHSPSGQVLHGVPLSGGAAERLRAGASGELGGNSALNHLWKSSENILDIVVVLQGAADGVVGQFPVIPFIGSYRGFCGNIFDRCGV